MSFYLSEAIISPEDLKSVINELKDYEVFFRHSQIKQHVVKRSAGQAPELSIAASELLSSAMEKKPLNITIIEQLITELERLLIKSPKIKIILAALPNHAVKKQLILWVRKNIKADALIEFSYNQSLLGGLVLTAGSRIFDWSLRQQLLNSQPKLNEMIAAHV